VFTDGFFDAAPNPDVHTFVEQFYARYQEAPTALAAHSYDTVLLCAEVLKTGVKTRLELRDGLLQAHNFQGVTGPATMDPDGDVETVPYLFTIRRGHVVQLQPVAPAAR
jgi:ABC-type branched-subunit amino acid transport system substrate-binding protein